MIQETVHQDWLAIRKNQLNHLINSMFARCKAVIVADEKQTKY